MSRLSISPSIVSAYEYWRRVEDPDREARALDELVSSIRGELFEMSDSMRLGRLWHEVVESPPPATRKGDERVYSVADDAGYSAAFSADDVDTFRSWHPDGTLREVSGRLELPEIDVVMHLRADGLSGVEVVEIKTTSRVDQDRYERSIQWRCYVLAFRAEYVTYDVCRLSRDRSTFVWRLAEHFDFQHYRYPGLRDDVLARVRAVADFIRQQGLERHRLEADREVATCP